jgi:hypothetical protein
MFVDRIIAAAASFCAIGRDGSIATWGKAADGGAIPSSKYEAIIDDGGVSSVIASTTAFVRLLTIDIRPSVGGGWGGGLMSATASLIAARGGVMLCKASRWAFCMVTERGEAESWGRNATVEPQ